MLTVCCIRTKPSRKSGLTRELLASKCCISLGLQMSDKGGELTSVIGGWLDIGVLIKVEFVDCQVL